MKQATTIRWTDRHTKSHIYLPNGLKEQAAARAATVHNQTFSAYVTELIKRDLAT